MLSSQEYENALLKCYNLLDEDDNVPDINKEEFLKLCNLIEEYEDYWYPLTP